MRVWRRLCAGLSPSAQGHQASSSQKATHTSCTSSGSHESNLTQSSSGHNTEEASDEAKKQIQWHLLEVQPHQIRLLHELGRGATGRVESQSPSPSPAMLAGSSSSSCKCTFSDIACQVDDDCPAAAQNPKTQRNRPCHTHWKSRD